MSRLPSHLTCPKCNYDLCGIIREDGTATCPECASEWIEMQRNRRPLARGVLLILGLIVAPAFVLPILTILLIEFALSYDNAKQLVNTIALPAIIGPVLWIPAVLTWIGFMYRGRIDSGGIGVLITTSVIFVPIALIAYYLLVLLLLIMTSGF